MRASVGLGSLNGCIGTASGRMAACGGGSWLGSGNVCCNDREDGLAHCQSCPWPTCVGCGTSCFLGSGGVASAGRRGACCDVSPGIDGRREAGDSDKCARPPCQHGKRVCWCWRGEGRMLGGAGACHQIAGEDKVTFFCFVSANVLATQKRREMLAFGSPRVVREARSRVSPRRRLHRHGGTPRNGGS